MKLNGNKINDRQIVGFFKSHNNTPLRMSLREKSILKNMRNLFKHKIGEPVFLLLTKSANPNNSIHSFDYKVFTIL